MKILFESYLYKTESLEGVLSERYYSYHNHTKSVVDYVGYYFNPAINDAVFILPKIFIYNNGLAFGIWSPEDIIDCTPEVMSMLKSSDKSQIIFDLSIWLYRAMIVFQKRKPDTEIIYNDQSSNIISNLDNTSTSILDIILSLVTYYKENRKLFTQVTKINHSQKHNIDWNKTVTKHLPILEDNIPIYIKMASNKKYLNFDEELIVIFYSVLNEFKRKFGFVINLNEQYKLIEKKAFEKLITKGTRKLKSIRYKYYSDSFLSLWHLLYTYFEKSEQIEVGQKKEEVLLVRNFNVIFEDMIDDLIGDTNIPSYLKNHKDGKQLDHIYRYDSLITSDDIYFVGDSKYYKPDNTIKGLSIDKQYTYAKNVVQYNIDLFNKGELCEKIRYRDPLTEGYNITPNFFISSLVDENYNFTLDLLEVDGYPKLSYHFKDRPFDRDSLILQNYNINFLFVISAYIARNKKVKDSFRDKARVLFRERMIYYLNLEYQFYIITPSEDIEVFITRNFRALNGKMYRPSMNINSFILAYPKASKINPLDFISDKYEIDDYRLM